MAIATVCFVAVESALLHPLHTPLQQRTRRDLLARSVTAASGLLANSLGFAGFCAGQGIGAASKERSKGAQVQVD